MLLVLLLLAGFLCYTALFIFSVSLWSGLLVFLIIVSGLLILFVYSVAVSGAPESRTKSNGGGLAFFGGGLCCFFWGPLFMSTGIRTVRGESVFSFMVSRTAGAIFLLSFVLFYALLFVVFFSGGPRTPLRSFSS